jgi:CRP-like cAMP-binding protein
MKTLEGIITAHPFAKDIPERFIHLLLECATLERFGAQQPIFREGADADHFFLLHSGHVVLETFVPGKGMVNTQTLSPGEALGWSWLYPPYRWHFTATAIEPVEVVALGARTLRARMDDNHDFGYDIAIRVGRVMLDRLQATRMRLLDLYGGPS